MRFGVVVMSGESVWRVGIRRKGSQLRPESWGLMVCVPKSYIFLWLSLGARVFFRMQKIKVD